MATDKIDVKADAREIANKYYKCSGHESRNEDGDDYNELVSELVTFASRVRDEAAREAVERIEKLLMMNSCGCLHAIRSAFAEPCSPPESPDSSPGALRQFVDAAVRLADAHMEYPASGHPDDMADTETILRLAPQFKEPKP